MLIMTRDSVTKDAQCSLYREVKTFKTSFMVSFRCLSFQHGTNNCSQGEKEVESGDTHQHTDLILRVTTHVNRKFSSLSDVIHSQK